MDDSTPMDIEMVIDHFFVFDNIAVFPIQLAYDSFPKFVDYINLANYDVSHVYRIVFAAVTSEHLITVQTFDNLQLFGCAIFNLLTRNIDYFSYDNSTIVKTRLLDVITQNLQGEIYINLYIKNLNFDIDANFFIKYGFIEPQLADSYIRLKYVKRPSKKLTMMQIMVALSSTKFNVLILKMFIPKVVATTLSKYLNEVNEASGNLSIFKYIRDNVALLGLNSDNIITGTEGEVGLPEKYSPFVFHTHPDHITREFKAFISWPSGQDMMVVALSYLEFRDQLVHFVPGPEGIWTIHITPEFQKLLVKLRTYNVYECSKSILESIFKVFTFFETPRLTEAVEAIDRYNIGYQYLATVKNYNLSRLFTDVPEIKESCKSEISEDAQLFNVSLIKWKHFSETPEEGVYLSFDYIVDIHGGLAPFLFPFV